VLDPFAGTGTALTLVAGRGDRALGIEAHPLIGGLAALKLERPAAPATLLEAVELLRSAAEAHASRTTLVGEPEVLRRFVPAGALRDLVGWRDAVDDVEGPWREHLRWLVLGALRDQVGRSWPYPSTRRGSRGRERPVAELVDKRAGRMVEDLVAAPRAPRASVIRGDARCARTWDAIDSGSVDACISSPPYLNQVSYAEITRLELHFLGYARTWREMNERVSSHLVASCTQQVTKARAESARARLETHPQLLPRLTTVASALTRAQRERARGKQYDRLLWAYFGDLCEVFENLRRVLAPGARAAWVIGDSALYGVYIDTPALIGALTEEFGLEVLDDFFLRERGRKWASVGGRHGRILSERMLVFRQRPLASQPTLPGFTPAAPDPVAAA